MFVSVRTCLVSLVVLSGCASAPVICESTVPVSRVVPGAVFVANGAGNFQVTTKALRNVIDMDCQPLEVITFDWSHGKYRILADQIGKAHAREQGKRLADAVVTYHAHNPERPIYLIGHSAGASVVMAALENLPESVVTRAVLLAPSLSAEYDVRAALCSVRQSLHVFYSRNDYFYLGLATDIVGTPDHRWTASAGRVGFRIENPNPQDCEMYNKLQQHGWRPDDRALGHNGGHFGVY